MKLIPDEMGGGSRRLVIPYHPAVYYLVDLDITLTKKNMGWQASQTQKLDMQGHGLRFYPDDVPASWGKSSLSVQGVGCRM